MLKEDITTTRSPIEVVFDILEIADRGGGGGGASFDNPYDDNEHQYLRDCAVQQTEVMNKAPHLDDGHLKGILKVLSENDLLSIDSPTRKFKITQKGRKFIQVYNKMNDLLKEA
jgi:predicted transcriptional regulator